MDDNLTQPSQCRNRTVTMVKTGKACKIASKARQSLNKTGITQLQLNKSSLVHPETVGWV